MKVSTALFIALCIAVLMVITWIIFRAVVPLAVAGMCIVSFIAGLKLAKII